MKLVIPLAVVLAAVAPAEAQPQDDGFVLHGGDDAHLKIGGFLQLDGRFFVADARDPHVDQFVVRSLRPDLQGTVARHFDFRLFPDLAGGKLVIQDAYVDVHYSDAFEVRFGKQKVPFGLERLQVETATTFVERGFPTQVAPNRDVGAMVFGALAGGALTYQLGVFNGVADGGSGDGDVSNGKELAARVFVRPLAHAGELVDQLGFGAAATFGDKRGTLASPDVGTFKTQGQTTFFQYKTGTTLMDTVVADGRHWRATAQGYWYAGPVGVLAEYVRSVQQIALDGTHDRAVVDAWQILGQWVITGEPASYRSVIPARPFEPSVGQWGAFDLAARLTGLRVDRSVFDGGFADPARSARRAWSAGVGLDWFANRNVRFVLDLDRTWYVLGAASGDRAAETSIIGRVQLAF